MDPVAHTPEDAFKTVACVLSADGYLNDLEWSHVGEAMDLIYAALRDAQQLRDALAFYAEERNWVQGEEREGSYVGAPKRHRSHTNWDRGERARAALSSEGQPRNEKSGVCGKQMRGLYGALSICSRPAGHPFRCDSLWDSREWTEGDQPRETQQGADEQPGRNLVRVPWSDVPHEWRWPGDPRGADE